MPEVIGRFRGGTILMEALSGDALTRVAEYHITQCQKELEFDGVYLDVADEVLPVVISRAIKNGTGARGVQTVFEEIISDSLYYAYSAREPHIEIDLYMDGDEIRWR